MSIEENKELVRTFYAEVINGRDVDAIDRLLSEDFTHNGERRGRDGQKQAVEVFLAGLSDLHNEIELILAEGDLVAAHQTWTGTHDGQFLSFAPTGRRTSFTSTAILRISGGEIAEVWDVADMSALQH